MRQQNFSQKDYGISCQPEEDLFAEVEPPQPYYSRFQEESDELLPIGNNYLDVQHPEFISNQSQLLIEINYPVFNSNNGNYEGESFIQRMQGSEQESTHLGNSKEIQEQEYHHPLHAEDEKTSNNAEVASEKVGQNHRSKDDNNAHKKFTTCLNKCLTTSLRGKIRNYHKKYDVKDEKSQRFWFIFRLLDIRQFSSKKEMENLKANFEKDIATKLGIPAGSTSTEAEIYLNQLIPYYRRSFDELMQGDIEGATAILYEIEGLKQRTYRKAGIQRVREYEAALFTRKLDQLQSH